MKKRFFKIKGDEKKEYVYVAIEGIQTIHILNETVSIAMLDECVVLNLDLHNWETRKKVKI